MIANCFKAMGHTKEHIKVAFIFIMHNNILSTISSAMRSVSAAGTKRAAWLLLATATLLPCGRGAMAQNNSDGNSLSPAIPGSVKDLAGQEITRATIGKYLSVGFDTDQSKQFVLYNVGTGLFLGTGGYWGSHAALTTIPRPFWLSGRSEEAHKQLPSYLHYAETKPEEDNGFVNTFFKMTDFQIGSKEGQLRTNIKYDKLQVVSNGQELLNQDGYQATGNPFYWEIKDFDFSSKDSYILAEMDISNVKGIDGNFENVLSVGEDIAVWGNEKTRVHIYIYTKGDEKRVRVEDHAPDYKETTHRFGGSDNKTTINVGPDNKLTVKITKDDIIVNGMSCVPINANNKIDRSIAPLREYSSFTTSKDYTDGTLSRHYYKETDELEKTETNINLGINPNSGTYKEYAGHLKRFDATIDLTSCTGTSENVLSIGNAITSWGDSDDSKYNIHIYYTKSTGKLEVNAIHGKFDQNEDKNRKTFWNVSGSIKVTLDENGLQIKNGDTNLDLTTWTNYNQSLLEYFLSKDCKKIQIGNAEGNSRSHASYSDVSLNYLTTGNVEMSETVEGNSFNVDLAKGEYLQGDISLEGMAEKTVLLTLKATASASSETTTTDIPSLTFTYQGEDEGHDVVQVKYDYDEASRTLDGYTRAINVNKGERMSFKFTNEGLIVDGKNLFPDINMLPKIDYDASVAGMDVRFKTDKFGNFLLGESGKFIVDQQNGKPFKNSTMNGYLYSMDDLNDQVAVFISSKFNKRSDASVNEGSYLAWRPYASDAKTYGDIGVFADRSLKPKGGIGVTDEQIKQQLDELLADSRWHFEPVTDDANYAGKQIYRLYLDMKDQTVLYVENQKQQPKDNVSGKFYLQAKQDRVLGNGFEPYHNQKTSTQADGEATYNSVEADTDDPKQADYAYWQLIPVSEYLQLFKGAKTDFEAMLDYSYLLSDPSFSRENPGLSTWVIDDTLLGTEHKETKHNSFTGEDDEFTVHDIRIGYDYYTKKALEDIDYTDNDGVKYVSKLDADNKPVTLYETQREYQFMSKRERNHARYMGFEVLNNANGRLYQEVTVNGYGWYAITCKGFTTGSKPAVLFIQKATSAKGEWVSNPLHGLTVDENSWLNSTEDKAWPYDCLYIDSKSTPLPLYNALVAMNDENTHTGPITVMDKTAADGKRTICGQELIDSLTTQVIFYVDKNDLDANGEVKLRFGINIEDGGTPPDFEIDAPRRPDRVGISTGDGSDVTFDLCWTVFDDFHLLYGGNAPDPHLVLNEDSTSLDYIDNSVHRFVDRPMNLVRTFKENSWNTIILPVNLSQTQFTEAFGNKAKLAQLDHLTEKTVEFKTVEEQNGVLLQAFKPYIIYIGEKQNTGEGKEYEGKLYMLGSKGLPKAGDPYYALYAPAGNFYASNVTLEANYEGSNTTKGYDFAHDSQAVKDSLYTYQGTTATDDSGTNSPLIAFGTLCKTYSGKEEGEHALLANRPTLQGAYVFNANRMIKIHNNYGVKGFRCWFTTQKEQGSTQSMSNLAVSIDGIWDGTTTIGSINATNDSYDNRHNDGVYNLNGQRLRSDSSLDGLPAGIYIVNGVKQSVR